jgi:hypothetical protein
MKRWNNITANAFFQIKNYRNSSRNGKIYKKPRYGSTDRKPTGRIEAPRRKKPAAEKTSAAGPESCACGARIVYLP